MLLRLERYPCRVNHAKGVLEARVQTYKHLRNLLVCLTSIIHIMRVSVREQILRLSVEAHTARSSHDAGVKAGPDHPCHTPRLESLSGRRDVP